MKNDMPEFKIDETIETYKNAMEIARHERDAAQSKLDAANALNERLAGALKEIVSEYDKHDADAIDSIYQIACDALGIPTSGMQRVLDCLKEARDAGKIDAVLGDVK